MTASRYTDYIQDLKAALDDLHGNSDRYQTFDLHAELAMGANLLVYETRKRKGQIDTMAYARTPAGNKPIAPDMARDRVLSFLAMQEHIALTGDPMISLNEEYPHAVISFEHRVKGAALKKSMKMIFAGVNDAEDAARYVTAAGNPAAIVSARPHSSKKLWEWK
jgi:hypothetical protein